MDPPRRAVRCWKSAVYGSPRSLLVLLPRLGLAEHAMQGPRTPVTACAVIAGIEAAQMIRKGQVLGITRKNLYGQAWVFGALLGLN